MLGGSMRGLRFVVASAGLLCFAVGAQSALAASAPRAVSLGDCTGACGDQGGAEDCNVCCSGIGHPLGGQCSFPPDDGTCFCIV